MEETTQEVSQPSQSAPESAPQSQPPSQEATPQQGEQKESGTQETSSQYTPNFKYKVNGQDKEFDEFIRPTVKNKETEEKIRKLYADAYGLEAVKPKYEELQKKYPEVETQFNQLNNIVTEVVQDRDRGDLDSVFEKLRIPEEKVAQWMLKKIEKMNLPKEQQEIYNQFEQTRRENLELKKQYEQLNGMTQNQAVQARTFELEQVLHRPDVSSFAAAFDAARKQPGAFKDEIRNCGLFEWKVNGKDISASDAAQMAMSRYQGMVSPTASGQTAPTPVAQDALPVIPQVKGKAISATGKQVRSIEDLRKKAQELAG